MRAHTEIRVTNRILPLLLFTPMVLILGVCSDSKAPAVAAPPAAGPSDEAAAPTGGAISGTIVETMDAAGYTYVLVDTGARKVWAAGPRTAVEVGEEVNLTGAMAMHDFRSQTLDRTFDLVFFVPNLKGGGGAPVQQGSEFQQAMPRHGTASQNAAPENTADLSDIQKATGGNTVAELFAGKGELDGKETAIRGRVVKFNAGIMGRNWIHIRDGSGLEGSNDLTVTTEDTARVGDLVVIRGTLKTNQDFGHGYSYELLVEKATVEVE